MSTNEAFRALDRWCRFLGLGDPRASLWSVGIEVGGDPHVDPLAILTKDYKRIPGVNIDCTHDCQGADAPAHLASKITDVWRLSAKLGAKVLQMEESHVAQALGRENSPVFLSNAYPLARRSADEWPYERYFRFPDYQDVVEGLRPGLLGSVRQALAPESVVVGHGQRAWHLHRKAFLREEESPELLWDGALEIYRRSRFGTGVRLVELRDDRLGNPMDLEGAVRYTGCGHRASSLLCDESSCQRSFRTLQRLDGSLLSSFAHNSG